MKRDSIKPLTAPEPLKKALAGQAMVEYVIMMALLLSTAVILSIFLYTYKQHSDRVVSLVGSEYP